jgi:protein gp37
MAKGSENGGCLNCYAARRAARGLPGLCFPSDGKPAARMTSFGPRWTGRAELLPHMLDGPGTPLRVRKPTTYFVNSMSDLFHESLPDEAIDRVFAVMALCPQHTFQVLTKRPERMARYFSDIHLRAELIGIEAELISGLDRFVDLQSRWKVPLPNVWLGVSCEDQKTADERIPLLLQTPAAVRFVSLEPMLGPIELRESWLYARCPECGGQFKRGWADCPTPDCDGHHRPSLDWVILGGESGPGARPMSPLWARVVRNQCAGAGVPFFFKQWGEWAPVTEIGFGGREHLQQHTFSDGNGFGTQMIRVGKTAAGHLLDGQEWRQMPEVRR